MPPVFNHVEVNNLYQNGLKIPVEKLREIIALPRQTVIEDLEKILKDAIDRYHYFERLDFEQETHNFPLHAICLLGELAAENSLPAILNFLENDEEVLEFWLGDHINSTIWLPIYLLSQNNSELLKQFLKKPGIYTYSKTAVSKALCQMILHQPGKRNEIATTYNEVLSYFSDADLKDNLIDSDFLGLAIGDIINCALIELLPVIKELFNKKYVSFEVNGTYEEVERYLKNPSYRNHKKDIENIFELYKDILQNWAGYSEDEGDHEEADYLEDYDIEQPSVSVKVEETIHALAVAERNLKNVV